ncbi:hypothetical protein [Salipaludibacillus sp. CF4.18]|uniref:hypothetical protein n=1 Tax=Salipaludibacillus sp. CF4.18 TaxID=3373081 RepID=UPI003EE6B368
MTNEKNNRNRKENDNFVKKTSQETTDLFGNTVDSAGRIIKSVSGEGGLVGKTTDASGRILKGTAGKANNVVGKTSEAPGKMYRSVTNRGKKRIRKNNNVMALTFKRISLKRRQGRTLPLH